MFAPATVANLGPGFDVLGLAIDGLGDWVRAERIDGPPGVEIGEITGDGGRLPRQVEANTASVSAQSVALRLGVRLRLHLEKGLPLSSGLGSSAASSVAGAVAAAVVGGQNLDEVRGSLLPDTLKGEQIASGAGHADNVGPSLLGGVVLITAPHQPTSDTLISLPVPKNLWLSLAIPALELDTRKARAALPTQIPLNRAVNGWARTAGMVAAFYRGDVELLGKCLVDEIVEPVRGALIPGFSEVKTAASDAGALACSISGAGPTLFALNTSKEKAKQVVSAMSDAWGGFGISCETHVTQPNSTGAIVLGDS